MESLSPPLISLLSDRTTVSGVFLGAPMVTPLLDELMVVALPSGHRLAQGDADTALHLRSLASETFILYGPRVRAFTTEPLRRAKRLALAPAWGSLLRGSHRPSGWSRPGLASRLFLPRCSESLWTVSPTGA